MKDLVREVLTFLDERRESISPLTILTHNYPDPDALASAFALGYLAKEKYGIDSRIIYCGVIGRMENRAMVDILGIPATRYEKIRIKEGEHVALVDTQPSFKNNPFPEDRRATLIIDQHPSSHAPNADLAIVQADIGATSVILAQCLLESKVKIPPNIATALAYGILSDTMNFFRCNDPAVVQAYLNILPKGDLTLLAWIQNPKRGHEYFNSLGRILQNCTVYGKTIVSHLGFVETPDLVAQAADFLLTYEKVEWSLCTARYEGKLYVSLRGSDAKIPAYKILRDMVPHRNQAGGHDVIAGGSFEVEKDAEKILWVKAEKDLLEKFISRLSLNPAQVIEDPFYLAKHFTAKRDES